MEQFFIRNLTIKKVRHLKNISIPLSEEKIRHLILTGKNGSGKTSAVEALAGYLDIIIGGSISSRTAQACREGTVKGEL